MNFSDRGILKLKYSALRKQPAESRCWNGAIQWLFKARKWALACGDVSQLHR